jgi:transglutaminase-like putative cysteine protease
MPKLKIHHITRYTYEVPVRDSANQIMLYPLDDEFQETVFQNLQVTGSPSIEIHHDSHENQVGTFTHSQPHDQLTIDSRLEVLTKKRPIPDDLTPAAEQWISLKKLQYTIPYVNFLKIEPFQSYSELKLMMEPMHNERQTPLTSATAFCSFVFTNFIYKKGITTVDTTIEEIWKLKSGVCQDFANILLVMLRTVKIPARYVSGYICPNKNGMRGEGATHAWVEAYIPFFGWLGLDPTNNCLVGDTHVRLAVGKNFYDCSPVRGTYRGTSNHLLEVAVTVGYEDEKSNTIEEPADPVTEFTRNSYRRHQEMQMMQQQQ